MEGTKGRNFTVSGLSPADWVTDGDAAHKEGAQCEQEATAGKQAHVAQVGQVQRMPHPLAVVEHHSTEGAGEGNGEGHGQVPHG